MAAAAVLAGARSMTAIAEWAADTLQSVRAALGACRESPDHYSVPAETTIRWALGRLNPQALATAIGAWLGDRDRPQQRRQAIAVDAKTLRGAKRDAGRSTCWPRWTTAPAQCWPNARSTAPPARSPPSNPCRTGWTLPGQSSPPTRSTPTPTLPSFWSPASRPTT
jgi:hypothetical protein